MTPTDGLNTSLTLTGGGSYAAYEIGVMYALFAGKSPATNYTPLDPDVLIGTSAGALNAAGLVAHEVRTGSLLAAVAELQSLWTDWIADGAPRCGNGVYRIRGLPFELLDRECLRRGLTPFVSEVTEDAGLFLRGSLHVAADFLRSLASPDPQPIRTLAQSVNFSSLISTAPFAETLGYFVPVDAFAQSTRRLRIVTLDLSSGLVKLFDENDMRRLGVEPLQASTALPIFFPPRQIEGQDYVNGTTLATTPLLPAIQESDTMHCVYMDPDLRAISTTRFDDIIDAMDRVMVVNFATMLNHDIELAQEINTALELIEKGVPRESLSTQEMQALLRTLPIILDRAQAGNPYRPLTIHRYHPRDDLGSDRGRMNLKRERIVEIIDRGYSDTVAHDCAASGCVFPGGRSAYAPEVAVVPSPPVVALESLRTLAERW
jgi:predicted acylesterase/phospholipase RssA